MHTEFNSDVLLWKRFLKGDSEAYSQIYQQTVKDLFQYGLLYTTDRELIKDCIHDVFVKIYANRANLNVTNNIMGYLIVALKNTLLNALQKNANHPTTGEPAPEKETATDHSTPETAYIKEEEEQQTKQTVRTIMAALPERQREIIYYRYMQDMSIQEIAEITDMNYQSVLNSIQRALNKVKGKFRRKGK
ncbi:RNA polymerase sigma factor [Bacteroides sp. 224]|uniref:RNA polymerase sigma factor n=1 Tax=Bacteroides sp. 224 TaxID=2302936 RepID=UPI0013D547EC|nr:sigma-70 family RNA polymerase sigma factor [Bacteroides sp. 224]NDV63715.1 sigma-70 family RNA polymerase sigma factor [Bacteroides sp. 224]